MIAYSVTERGRALRIAVVLLMLELLIAGGASAATLKINYSNSPDYTADS